MPIIDLVYLIKLARLATQPDSNYSWITAEKEFYYLISLHTGINWEDHYWLNKLSREESMYYAFSIVIQLIDGEKLDFI